MDTQQFLIAITIVLISTLLFFKFKTNKYKKLNINQLYFIQQNPVQRKTFDLLAKGQIAEFKKHIEENQIDPNLQDFQNLHLLHCAVGLCNKSEEQGIEAIKFLLEKGAAINCLDQSGRTPILMASNWNIYPVVDLLCSLNADLNETKFHHVNTLFLPFIFQNISIQQKDYPVNPLYFLLQRGNYEMAWHLIQKGSSVEKIEMRTQIFFTAKIGNPQQVQKIQIRRSIIKVFRKMQENNIKYVLILSKNKYNKYYQQIRKLEQENIMQSKDLLRKVCKTIRKQQIRHLKLRNKRKTFINSFYAQQKRIS